MKKIIHITNTAVIATAASFASLQTQAADKIERSA